ncbi:hypothetical protein AYL99_02440 [Fonsecaea erecta]|uniref:Uncharacterized protein n=1 Tax=Fonsecaea erecta TaxID=1367422 RepID=A0A178ZVD9_9EURO|nr:hypothetical protein AYL99_02440 [Fonsecaea erecta]OAP63213.1 hypothetical protein AYL99_02440 [Fonsecaea erecta]
MLRRKPTALTITNEDIAAFDEAYLRRLAYAKYLKTGEDPEGLFGGGKSNHHHGGGSNNHNGAMTRATTTGGVGVGFDAAGGTQAQAQAAVVDPNDELKPLPGDKARIVRSREERIMGGGGATGGGGR